MALTIKMRIDENPEHSYVFSTGDGGQIELIPLSVVQNGEYRPAEANQGFNLVTVNVPTPVVESLNITENGSFTSESGHVWNVVNVNVEPLLEMASRTITENGTQTITPSEGFDGISEITIVTDVPTPEPNLESLNETITQNGSFDFYPSAGVDGFDVCSLFVDVPSSGGGDFHSGTVTFNTTGIQTISFPVPAGKSVKGFAIWCDESSTIISDTVYRCYAVFYGVRTSESDGYWYKAHAEKGSSSATTLTFSGVLQVMGSAPVSNSQHGAIVCDEQTNTIKAFVKSSGTTYGLRLGVSYKLAVWFE